MNLQKEQQKGSPRMREFSLASCSAVVRGWFDRLERSSTSVGGNGRELRGGAEWYDAAPARERREEGSINFRRAYKKKTLVPF